MADHDYNPNCGCPGCQFIWAGLETFKQCGPPSVIGTFEPIKGDIGRDFDGPGSPYRTWDGERWWPYFEVVPRRTA